MSSPDFEKNFLRYINDTLEHLIEGRYKKHEITAVPDNPLADGIVRKLESLAHDLEKIQERANRLSNGKIEPDAADETELCSGQIRGLLSLIEKRLAELEKTSSTEAMTGMLNKRAGMLSMEKRLLESEAEEEHCLAFIDLDGLKQINDSFGHQAGDLFIISMAGIISSSIRRTDIAARYGGDEFLVFFVRCNKNAAEEKMLEMQGALHRLNISVAYPYNMSFSWGIASSKLDHPLDIWEMVYLADRRMYANKRYSHDAGSSMSVRRIQAFADKLQPE